MINSHARHTLRLALGALALGLVSCFGAPSASFHDPEFEKGSAHARLGRLGTGWSRLEVAEEDLAFQNAATDAVVTFQASCDKHYEDAPLKSLTRHLWFGLTELTVQDQHARPLDGRDALDSRIEGKLDGVPLRLRTVVLKKDGCVFDFTLTQPKPDDRWAGMEADFEAFVEGFQGSAKR